MEWLKTLFVVLQVVSALAIIGLVLIQQGKGADMGAAFGSGSSGSVLVLQVLPIFYRALPLCLLLSFL